MRKVILSILTVVILLVMLFSLTGCTLQIETTDNSVCISRW